MREKLIRDKVPKHPRTPGAVLKTRRATKKEFRSRFLPLKLVEEAKELLTATSKKGRVDELADIYEVLDAFLAANNISIVKVHSAQQRKYKKLGGFDKRTVLIEEDGGE